MIKIIKVGNRVLNFATLADVWLGKDGEFSWTTTAPFVEHDNPNLIIFYGEDAAALRWYFSENRTNTDIYDVVKAYREHIASEAARIAHAERHAKLTEQYGWAGNWHITNYVYMQDEADFNGTFDDWIRQWAKESVYFDNGTIRHEATVKQAERYLEHVERWLTTKDGTILSFREWL